MTRTEAIAAAAAHIALYPTGAGVLPPLPDGSDDPRGVGDLSGLIGADLRAACAPDDPVLADWAAWQQTGVLPHDSEIRL